MKRNKKGCPDRELFLQEMEKLLSSDEIRQMASFEQHRGNNTLQHSKNVAYKSFALAQKLGWKINERELARGAMLHDYYLYNIQEEHISDYRHGIGHPRKALENARKIRRLSPKEENIIKSHMWPLTLFHPPHSREAALVCMADKVCAINEMFLHKKDLVK